MKYTALLFTLFIWTTHYTSIAQPRLNSYPQVQKAMIKGEAVPISGIQLNHADQWLHLVNRTPVKDLLKQKSPDSWELSLSIDPNSKAAGLPENKAKIEGAYDLSVSNHQIHLSAPDSLGVFYGLQTLHQLIREDKIIPVVIYDFPTVRYRGVVEGFYGAPWTQENRMDQLKFYGSVKANTYIYGPKDDPYHSSPNWRKPYPQKEAENISRLVQVARENFVDFVWAIHPGKDIQWNEEDRQNVLSKFEHLYDLGVRSFALFFDDITGEGTNAAMQADLLNYLTHNFVNVKKDVNPLILTPTDYNKSWAGSGPEDYLSVLGKTLDPSIQIMWTGDFVLADVTQATLDWVNKRIQRPALIWWNFPVSDYNRELLLLGPAYGLEKKLSATDMAGILTNPMEHAEASKPAIFSVADYGWNTARYDSRLSWRKGIERILPQTADSYRLFAENTADTKKNLYFEREESNAVHPLISAVYEDISYGISAPERMHQLQSYFEKFPKAVKDLQSTRENPELLKEIMPWLEDFAILGETGAEQTGNYLIHNETAETYWYKILANKASFIRQKSAKLRDGKEVIPQTGTKIIRPFVAFLKERNNRALLQKITEGNEHYTQTAGLGKIETTIDALKNVRLTTDRQQNLKIEPGLEPFKIKSGEGFTLHLNKTLQKAQLKISSEYAPANWAKIEVSDDRDNWTVVPSSGSSKISETINLPFSSLKISNATEKEITVRLLDFEIANPEADPQLPYQSHDADIYTFVTLAPRQTLIEHSRVPNPKKLIILTDSGKAKIKVESFDNSQRKIRETKSGEIIRMDVEAVNEIKITAQDSIRIHEVIWL